MIIPTYNAAAAIRRQVEILQGQQDVELDVLVLDSSSQDDTAKEAKDAGARVIVIEKEQFDHAGTRTLGAKLTNGEFILYLTQDAVPCGSDTVLPLIERLRKNPKIAAVYGRQLPSEGANFFASSLRRFNYPKESFERSYQDRKTYGIRTAFLSDSFCAYRREALAEVGYFYSRVPFGEDMLAGARLLKKGYRIGYEASACVFHSHNYSLADEFHRYFKVGRMHRAHRWLIQEFGEARIEGQRYLRQEAAAILRSGKWHLLGVSFLRGLAKFAGYQAGKRTKLRGRCIRAGTGEQTDVTIQFDAGHPPPSIDAVKDNREVRLAIVCDWLTGMRGGERCVEAICQAYPNADIYTLVHEDGKVSEDIESHPISHSYIQQLPGSTSGFRRYLPLFPAAMESFELGGYEAVLSFSHCVAKGAICEEGIAHLCYCHTPMRYAWHMRDVYLAELNPVSKTVAAALLKYLKQWDQKTAHRVDRYIANSRNVQGRIREVYGRESEVIYPPVECRRFSVSEKDEGYYLVLSALVPYKRIDLAVETFSRYTSGRKLIVVGNGPELEHLRMIAGKNVEFVSDADDALVTEFLQNCRALIFPGEEDFGIVPLEAQASGKCVIAYGRGGALETVLEKENAGQSTGLFFHKQDPGVLSAAIEEFEKNLDQYDPYTCRNNAQRFDKTVYVQKMSECIEQAVERFRKGLNPERL